MTTWKPPKAQPAKGSTRLCRRCNRRHGRGGCPTVRVVEGTVDKPYARERPR